MPMNSNLSLPVEYQLKYGTAFGNLDFTQFVNNPVTNCFVGIDGCLLQEELLSDFRTNTRTLLVDSLDPLLVGSDRIKPLYQIPLEKVGR